MIGSFVISNKVCLPGMSHYFAINMNHGFCNKVWNQLGNFFKRSWFFAFGIWKKRRLCVSNLLFLLWLIFIPFSMIIAHDYCFSNIFNDFFKCHLTKNFRKKKHTHTLHCFSWKNHGQSFFLNHLLLHFNSRKVVVFIFASSPYLKYFVEFYVAKSNSAKIYFFLNIYSVKVCSFKVTKRSY